MDNHDDDSDWCSINEAARRLQVTATAIRNRINRGTLKTKPNGNHGRLVRVPLPVTPIVTDTVPPTVPLPVTLTDTGTVDALTAHIATLREMVSKAEAMSAVDRERADSERALADSERERANALSEKIETILTERALAAEQSVQLAGQVEELKAIVEQMRRRPWWKRLARS